MNTTGHAEDFAEMLEEFGTTATVNAVDVQGIFTDLTETSELGPGGYMDGYDATLIAKYSEGSAVALGDKVTVDGTEYRVISLRKSMDNITIEFRLQNIER